MAIALAATTSPSLWTKAGVLAIVAVGITAIVYGGVALIVKADDVGLALSRRPGDGGGARFARGFGRALVRGMPGFLKALSIVGTAAMIWVGGGIVLHGLEEFGIAGPAHLVHDLAHGIGAASPVLPGAIEWLVGAAGAGIAGC
jgi:predicted DNA repair protein MutK